MKTLLVLGGGTAGTMMANKMAETLAEDAWQIIVIDRDKASHAELERCVDVVGHEIAHQWFGNLVTMRWWEGAWLNEAFASFMELKATAAMHPEWMHAPLGRSGV